jgi:peroxiredoxin
VSTDTIAGRTDVMLEGFLAQIPGEAAQAFAGEQAGLDEAGVPAGAARAGTPMPDGDLLDVDGLPTTLTATRGGRPAVVVLYRGAWCPFCQVALRAYQEQLQPELARRGAVLIAISPQSADGSLTAREASELTFTVLSDPGNQVASQLGVLTAPSPEAVEAQALLGLDLTALNADGTRALPMPTVAVVDPDGVIRWIDVHPNYATRTETADILAAYDARL